MEQSFIHADIFFFISTIALVGVSIGVCIALYYLIHILRDIREISDKVKTEGSELIDDVRAARLAVKEEGLKMKHVFQIFRGLFIRKTKKHDK